MIAAVTGANGYLGSRIVTTLREAGLTVHELKRSGPDAVAYTLGEGAPEGYFRQASVDVLIHCAWDLSLVREKEMWNTNVAGSVALLEQAAREGVQRIIFVSTISAYDGCRSLYGRTKLAVEQRARELGCVIVRPGLVFGGQAGGIVGAMAGAIAKLPVLPLVGNGKQVLYPCHEDDLTKLILHLSQVNVDSSIPVVAAGEDGWTFRQILASLAGERRLRLLPIPWRAVWALLKTAESAGMRPGFRSDSVLSLVRQDPAPNFAARQQIPVAFRGFATLTSS